MNRSKANAFELNHIPMPELTYHGGLGTGGDFAVKGEDGVIRQVHFERSPVYARFVKDGVIYGYWPCYDPEKDVPGKLRKAYWRAYRL